MGCFVANLTVRYGNRVALDDVSLPLEGGGTLLLGPNGAGKSTLLGAIAGVRQPTAGHVELNGSTVALLPQATRSVRGLTALDQVAYAGWLTGLSRAAALTGAARALDRVGLGASFHSATTSLSGGQLRRVGLAQALVAEPGVLLLDEPTAGLDPAERRRFRGLIGELVAGGTITVVATHLVDDLDSAAESIVVLARGAIAFSGSKAEFLRHGGPAPTQTAAAEVAYEHLVRVESCGN